MNPDLNERISRLELEEWALGTLGAARSEALVDRARHDKDLRARMDRVRAEVASAGESLPPLRLDPSPGWRRFLSVRWLVPVLAMEGALLGVLVTIGGPEPASSASDAQWRGTMDLQIWRIRNGEPLDQGIVVAAREGDRIQYRLSPSPGAEGRVWAQVFDVQDDHRVSCWLEPREVGPGQIVEGASLLDAYRGLERVYFIFSPTPLGVADVETAIQQAFSSPIAALDALPLQGVTQRSILLVREDWISP